jgi:hypothetical protein
MCFLNVMSKYENFMLHESFMNIYYIVLQISWCRAYFAVSLLNVVTGLLDNSKQDAVQIIGCQTLTRFIYSQVSSEFNFIL